MTPVRLEPATPKSRVKYSTTEPLRSHHSILLKTVNVLKFFNTFLFLFLNRIILLIRAGIHKKLSEYQTEKTLIRLLLQKQSDLGLHCLSGTF